MTSIVLEDDGGFIQVKSPVPIFFCTLCIPYQSQKTEKSHVFQVSEKKVLYIYIVFLEEDRMRVAEFWSFFPLFFSTFI